MSLGGRKTNRKATKHCAILFSFVKCMLRPTAVSQVQLDRVGSSKRILDGHLSALLSHLQKSIQNESIGLSA